MSGSARAATVQPRWRPLVSGDRERAVWEAIDAIAEAIPAPQDGDGVGCGLARGHAGVALFFAYLGTARRDWAARRRALDHLDASVDRLASEPVGPGLFGGFTGVAWVMRHLSGDALSGDGPPGDGLHGDGLPADATEEIDEVLADLLSEAEWAGPYDLLDGLAGFALYLLEGVSSGAAGALTAWRRRSLARVVAELERLSEPHDGAASWFTAPESLPEHQRAAAPHGYFNAGVAHGMAGVLPVLARCAAAGVEAERAASLLDRAMTWLLRQRQPEAVGSAFPNWVGSGVEAHASRLAWCYGDAGVAASVLLCARQAGRADWELTALEVARQAAARPAERCGVEDAGLCHGASGLFHLFHRLFRSTGDPALARAARDWLDLTLAQRTPGQGVGGYRAWHSAVDGWHDDEGWLTGAAGVGLALLAAVTSTAPEWDRLLLCPTDPAVPVVSPEQDL